eukprot:1346353-Prymnesium_polylepis.4
MIREIELRFNRRNPDCQHRLARMHIPTQEMLTLIGIVLRRLIGLVRCHTLYLAICGNLDHPNSHPSKYATIRINCFALRSKLKNLSTTVGAE